MAVRVENEQSKLDVYARPFVPHIFRAINQAPANILTSTPAAWIDFEKYMQQFAGSHFLTMSDSSTRHLAPEYRTITSDSASEERIDVDPDSRDLEPQNYEAYFKGALEQEAIAQQQECDDHALYRVPVIGNSRDRRTNMYLLHVPGLREMSLRIEGGDVVQLRQLRVSARGEVLAPLVVKHPNGNYANLPRPAEIQHDSVVWSIDRRSETLSLRIDHLARMSMLFNVCFTVQSGRIYALYRAVSTAAADLSTETDESWMRSMLFPKPTDGYYQKALNKFQLDFDLYDELLNYEQTKAVNTVLNETYGPVPFIISGPPGTGKTKTIVELALQKISNNKKEHLLLCAPSDPAADTLVQRLSKHLGPSELLRINSPARSFPEVPISLLSYCCIEDGVFALPPFRELMSRRIVVTTCRDADLLIQARLRNADLFRLEGELYSAIHPDKQLESRALHWTGLLIDEAAQATEPEALIPLIAVAPPTIHQDKQEWPVFVMAGDQHQLGPRTASKKNMIQTSLFERLLNRTFYRDHPLARSKQSGGIMRPLTQEMLPILRPAFANLIRNYRSHPAILATPSSLFYNDTLEPEATATESLLSWPGWRGTNWPVLFTCNGSPDEIEQDGGGWYNITEANIACQYARSFLQNGLLQPHEICIMSPFQAQVQLIRRFARENAMSGVNIGPLEAFQGLESRLVVLCTTRTRDRFIDQDLAKGLGVIHEPKRFNVALTRAKEGLIVIGNPDVLKQDESWTAFLSFCVRNDLIDGTRVKSGLTGAGEGAAVSRLEKQLLHRVDGDDATGGALGLSNGFRKLGFVEHPDHAMWKSGVAIEAALRDRQKARDRQLRSH